MNKPSDFLRGLRWSSYSPDLAREFGLPASIFVCWLMWKRLPNEGWFTATRDEIMDELGISHEQQEAARRALGPIVEVKRDRLKHVTSYRVNDEALDARLEKYIEGRRRETGKPGVGKPENPASTIGKELVLENTKSELAEDRSPAGGSQFPPEPEDARESPSNPCLSKATPPQAPPPIPPPHLPNRQEAAIRILAHLSAVSGVQYRPTTKKYLDGINARLREVDWDEAGVIAMINSKGAEWAGTDFHKNLNPVTLFRPGNFQRYYDQRNLSAAPRRGKGLNRDSYGQHLIQESVPQLRSLV